MWQLQRYKLQTARPRKRLPTNCSISNVLEWDVELINSRQDFLLSKLFHETSLPRLKHGFSCRPSESNVLMSPQQIPWLKQTHPQITWTYFLKHSITSSTSSLDPRKTGDRWWMLFGITSSIGEEPVVARPPACSMIYAIGIHSYSNRNCNMFNKIVTNMYDTSVQWHAEGGAKGAPALGIQPRGIQKFYRRVSEFSKKVILPWASKNLCTPLHQLNSITAQVCLTLNKTISLP